MICLYFVDLRMQEEVCGVQNVLLVGLFDIQCTYVQGLSRAQHSYWRYLLPVFKGGSGSRNSTLSRVIIPVSEAVETA